MPRLKSEDALLLNAALEGLELQKQRIEEQIKEVRARLGRGAGQRGRPRGSGVAQKADRRPLSAAARKRIAAAQKRRWAAYRKTSGAPQ